MLVIKVRFTKHDYYIGHLFGQILLETVLASDITYHFISAVSFTHYCYHCATTHVVLRSPTSLRFVENINEISEQCYLNGVSLKFKIPNIEFHEV